MGIEIYERRLAAVRRSMEQQGIAAMFLSPSANLEYVSGELRPDPFPTSFLWPSGWINGLWITLDHNPTFTVPRMAADYDLVNAVGWSVRVLGDEDDPVAFLRGLAADFRLSGRSLAVEDRAWSRFLTDLLAAEPDVTLTPASIAMLAVRAQKDEHELALMRKACEITDIAFGELVSRMQVGMTEVDLIAELELQLKKLGSRAAYPIGAWGWGRNFPRTRLDTGRPLSAPFEADTTIAFDFGAWWKGYCTDFSRVVHFADPGPEYRAAYEGVKYSQDAAIAAMRHEGGTAEEIYEIGMSALGEHGLRQYFPDRLGHGIGMDVHELPSLIAGDATVLKQGMVLTVEPQVFNGPMHIRLEDLVMVGPSGGVDLNAFSRELLVLG